MRKVVAQYTSEQVYSTARKEIQDKVRELTVERMGEKMMEREGEASYGAAMRDTVILYDTLLYGIILPQDVVNASNRKAEQYYISDEYKFRIEREKPESERQKIEAEGIELRTQHQLLLTRRIKGSPLVRLASPILRRFFLRYYVQLCQSRPPKLPVQGDRGKSEY